MRLSDRLSDLLALLPPEPLLILREGDRAVLAEQALEGLVAAEAYQSPRAMHCVVPVADLMSDEGQRIDQLIYGEAFDVLFEQDQRLWGRARRDGVIGWVQQEQFKSGAPMALRRVVATDVDLPLNALVAEDDRGLDASALGPVGEFDLEPVAVAERLLGCPHALGARTSFATDCSGLVQQALMACGLAGPRRSEAQARLGRAVAASEAERGDLVIWLMADSQWTGHSGIMVDGEQVIHSTGHHGRVIIEPVAEVEARMTAAGYSTATYRRL